MHTHNYNYQNKVTESVIPSHLCAHFTPVPVQGFTSPEIQRNLPCNGVKGGLKEVYLRLHGDEVPGGGRRGVVREYFF